MQSQLPTRGTSQVLGDLAEHQFDGSAKARGWIVHPTLSGNDFGIDRRVEVVDRCGRLDGLEFFAQIKGRERLELQRNGSVAAGAIRLTTINYWLAKLTPTLLVVYGRDQDRSYWQWAHRAFPIEQVANAEARNQSTLKLSIPAGNIVDNEGLDRIEADARQFRESTADAIVHEALYSSFLLVYRLAADVSDVLLEQIAILAFDRPEDLARRFTSESDNVQETIRAFQEARLRIPYARENDALTPVLWSISSFIAVLRSFIESGVAAGVSPDYPVLAASASVKMLLERYYLRMIDPADRNTRETRLKRPSGKGLRWLRIQVPEALTSLGLISLVLRHYQRAIRQVIFPPLPGSGKTTVMHMIKDVAEELVHPAETWSSADAWTPNPGPQADS